MSKKKQQERKPVKSTALAVRPRTQLARPVVAPSLPTAGQLVDRREAVGLIEIKLTKAEEKVLSRPVNTAEILIKPSGQPYLSHPSYTRWFNEAFGRLGWSIVSTAPPQYNGKTVIMDHVLCIHGVPVAKATGEQEYYEKNREQTYGDAIEACTASALRRCAKRLGVGLELWDKSWLNQWIAENAVCVTVNDRGESKARWRRKVDPPLRGEIHAGGSRKKGPQTQQEFHGDEAAIDAEYRPHEAEDGPRDGHSGMENEPITEQQVARLHTVATKVKRANTEVRMWLKVVYGYDSSKQIKRREYNTILRTIEAPGPLPMRDPGQEG